MEIVTSRVDPRILQCDISNVRIDRGRDAVAVRPEEVGVASERNAQLHAGVSVRS